MARTAISSPRSIASPTDLANCGLWLDASQLGLADGTAVSSWTDLSGNGRHAVQATGSQQPILKTNIIGGKPVVRYDGVNDESLITSAGLGVVMLSTAKTIFCVYQFRAQLALQRVVNVRNGAGSSQLSIRDNGTILTCEYYNGSSLSVTFNGSGPSSKGYPTVASTPNTPHVLTYMQNGSIVTWMIDGLTVIGVARDGSSDATATVMSLGSANTNNFGSVDIAEMIVYERALSDYELRLVSEYLA